MLTVKNMKKTIVAVLILISTAGFLYSQSVWPDKKLAKPGINWIKITWYKPLAGTQEPDKSQVPDIYMRPNQLLQYNKEGRLMSAMDYQRGSDELSGPTLHYYWDGANLKKEVQENDQYEAIYTTIYSYDAAGNEIKNVTQRGPGDKFGITANGTVENTWVNGKLYKTVLRNYELVIAGFTTFSYDAKGLKTREDYSPLSLYSAQTFLYDTKGNLVNQTYLDKESKPSAEWLYEYDQMNRIVTRSYSEYNKGVKQSTEVTVMTYDANGGRTSEVTTKDGKITSEYKWQHTYDAKGNRIQTVHFKKGKVDVIEVLKLTYY